MLNLEYPRDLVMTAAIFGVAAFVWAGWAQEAPPKGVVWRVVLGALSLAGAVLAAVSIPHAMRLWNTPTAITAGSGAFVVYVIVFWVEVAVCIALAVWMSRAGRADLIAPLILAVVGVHFLPLAAVFEQPIMAVAGAVLTIVAIAVALMPESDVARSFWCGVVAAPVFLAAGTWCAVAGVAGLPEG